MVPALILARIPVAPGTGDILVSSCPGRSDMGHDLDADLDIIRGAGAEIVVTLVEQHELDELDVSDIGDFVRMRDMMWFHLPIRDFGAPDSSFEARWRGAGQTIRETLHEGACVYVHCRGGLGRSGMIAARILVEMGAASPQEAIDRVRSYRPGAIETDGQENAILSLESAKNR